MVDDAILGKPIDANDAARMLGMLSGRVHQVITGVCLVGPRSDRALASTKSLIGRPTNDYCDQISSSETTLVTFTDLKDSEIRDYVATGESMDKAGAYAIQGIASRWIPRIEGDYSNVVGLPVALVYRMLRGRFG